MAELDLDTLDPRTATPGQVADLIAEARTRGEALDRVTALLDQREDEHADFLRRIETGEVIMLDRFIGPPQVLVRDMREAIGDTL